MENSSKYNECGVTDSWEVVVLPHEGTTGVKGALTNPNSKKKAYYRTLLTASDFNQPLCYAENAGFGPSSSSTSSQYQA
jgi:hypothetical protein